MDARARIGGKTQAAVVAWLALGAPFLSSSSASVSSATTPKSSPDVEFVAAAAATPGEVQLTTATTPESANTQPSRDADTKQFMAELERFRGGDASVASSLKDCVERLATRHGFENLRQVLAFYSKLDIADRKRGLEAEAAWNKIRVEVRDAGNAALPPAQWRAMRPLILARLQAIVDATLHAPDFSPAARALALQSVVLKQRVLDDPEMPEETKASWIQSAREDAQRSIDMFERIGMISPRLEPLTVLAELSFAEDQWSEAEDGFEEVLHLARRCLSADFESRALHGLLRLAQDSGDLQRTSMLSNELAAVAAPQDTWPLARYYGEFLLSLDEPDRAAEYLVRNKPTGPRELAEWHLLMSGVLTRKGDSHAANAHFEALLEVSNGTPIPGTEAWAAHAERLLLEKRHEEVLTVLDQMPDINKVGLLLRSNVLRIRGAALLALGDAKGAAATLESALRSGDAADARLAGMQSTSSSVIGETIGLETVALLARARIALGDPLGAALVIEDQQSRALRGALCEGRPSTLVRDDLVAWSNAYELGFVTWVIGADSSTVVYVSRGGSATAVNVEIGRKQLEDAVGLLRESATSNYDEQCRRLAQEIQAAILPAAILEQLPASPAASGARLLVLAHGPLERLPFDLLDIFSDARTRRIVPVVLPGILEHTAGVAPDRSQFTDWSILGDPVDPNGVTQLAGAQRELDALASMHPGSRVAGARAFDREALATALASKRPLHLATHLRVAAVQQGVHEAHLARAGFVLSRGELFDADEIRRAHPTLPLAVLSACETGSGQFVDAEASVGVSRAFLESGTRNLLVTLWAVEDNAAREYAIAFHRSLAAGKSPSRAAFAARQELRDHGVPTSEWAAFRLVGRD